MFFGNSALSSKTQAIYVGAIGVIAAGCFLKGLVELDYQGTFTGVNLAIHALTCLSGNKVALVGTLGTTVLGAASGYSPTATIANLGIGLYAAANSVLSINSFDINNVRAPAR